MLVPLFVYTKLLLVGAPFKLIVTVDGLVAFVSFTNIEALAAEVVADKAPVVLTRRFEPEVPIPVVPPDDKVTLAPVTFELALVMSPVAANVTPFPLPFALTVPTANAPVFEKLTTPLLAVAVNVPLRVPLIGVPLAPMALVAVIVKFPAVILDVLSTILSEDVNVTLLEPTLTLPTFMFVEELVSVKFRFDATVPAVLNTSPVL